VLEPITAELTGLRQQTATVRAALEEAVRRNRAVSTAQLRDDEVVHVVDGATVIEVVYATADHSSELVRFRYDPRTQTVTRS